MIGALALTISAIGWALAPSQVDVGPDDKLPSVIIEGEELTTATGSTSGTNSSAAAPRFPNLNGRAGACVGALTIGACEADPAAPSVDVSAEIRRAVESVGLPALGLRIQPGGETLVNVATIFHTEAPEFRHSTVLLGQAVEITATPSRFTWHHGDGTTQTTSTPGAPYPSTAVTHRYTRVASGLTPRVDVGYRVTYRINGGTAQQIDQLITASGPPAGLDVAEAAPVVVAP